MKKQLGATVLALAGLFAVATPALAASISSQMDIGTRGIDVTTLQQTLAADTSLYPQGLVTGYFGSLSAAAVQRFQTKYGIVSGGSPSTTGYGRVGPATMAKFNEVYGGASMSAAAPAFTNVTLSPNNSDMGVSWTTDQPATGVIYYSTSPLIVTEASAQGQAPGVSGTNVMTMTTSSNTTNSLVLSNTTASTTYYYMIQATSPSGVSVTWPSTFKTN